MPAKLVIIIERLCCCLHCHEECWMTHKKKMRRRRREIEMSLCCTCHSSEKQRKRGYMICIPFRMKWCALFNVHVGDIEPLQQLLFYFTSSKQISNIIFLNFSPLIFLNRKLWYKISNQIQNKFINHIFGKKSIPYLICLVCNQNDAHVYRHYSVNYLVHPCTHQKVWFCSCTCSSLINNVHQVIL